MSANTFGQWIRQMRESRHMTREDLIAALKARGKTVAHSTLTTWEHEGANPPIHDPEFVQTIASVFNVTGAEVLMGAGFSLGPAYEGLDEDQKLLLMAYESGDLERLIRTALMAKDKQGGGGDYSRLATTENDESKTAGVGHK